MNAEAAKHKKKIDPVKAVSGEMEPYNREGIHGYILVAMARPEVLVQELAERVEMSPPGIWYLCRRYEERGLDAVWDAPRSGRPSQFSPLGTRTGRALGLL